jgi:hypothetical protein
MKKITQLLTALLILASAVSTPIKSQTIDAPSPRIGWYTWDQELLFCYGPANNCYLQFPDNG